MIHTVRGQRRLILIFVLALVVMTFAAGPALADDEPRVDYWLTILHNNDGESQLIDYGPGILADFGGAARFATVVENLKDDATTSRPAAPGAKRGVIMVSSGDNFLAGPEFNAGLENGIPFYDTIALDLIGYDAIALGNHDFDFGPDVLADFISGYSYTLPPYLSANLDFSAEPRLQAFVDEGRIAKSVIVKERGDRIGIIGATTDGLATISSPRDVIVNEVVPAVQAEVDYLLSMGVDKIILISHLQSIDEDLAMASLITGLDVMVAGGGDELLANPDDLLIPEADGTRPTPFGSYPMIATDGDGHDIPVVTTSGNYGYVGNLVVGFDKEGNVIALDDDATRPVRVAGGTCGETLPCDDAVMPDALVTSMVTEPLSADLEALLNNVIATTEVGLNVVRPQVRTVETNEGNLIADSLLWQAGQLATTYGVTTPDVAMQNGGGIRNDSIIGPGDLTELDTFAMVPFPNFLSVVEDVPRDQFKQILENAYSRVEFTDGRFAQIAGFSIVYDAAATPMIIDTDGTILQEGHRVLEVVLDSGEVIVTGGVVQAGDPLSVATIDFLAKGGDRYPFGDLGFTTLGTTYQQALANYLTDGLGGIVSSVAYPEGGEGRITRLN